MNEPSKNCRLTLIKIPKNLFWIKKFDSNLYVAFLDFKMFHQNGIISTKDINRRKADRSYYRYWLEKLIKRGWAIRRGKFVHLRSYQWVWYDMGMRKCWVNNLKIHKCLYWVVDPETLSLNRKEYRKELLDKICKTIVDNKVRQIKNELKSTGLKTEQTETLISCRAVGKLLGIESPIHALKYRAKYFNVIPEKTVCLYRPVILKDGRQQMRPWNLCKRVAI